MMPIGSAAPRYIKSLCKLRGARKATCTHGRIHNVSFRPGDMLEFGSGGSPPRARRYPTTDPEGLWPWLCEERGLSVVWLVRK